ncbi:MAG: hypothetical protein AAAB35_17230 [Phyllobacterium sp.]|uniref:hypothetical protein n=1 Tax=Phyllobacterium sp. TaxID=1871046 RepID=UPI0030F26594
MSAASKLKIIVLTGTIGLLVLDAGIERSVPGLASFVTTAEARVGRPLTPVSVAGVARRSARRCAVGVYNC